MRKVALLCFLGLSMFAFSQDSTAKKSDGTSQSYFDKLDYSVEVRTRWEGWNNVSDHNDKTDDERDWYRHRTRLFLTAPVSTDVTATVTLGNEFSKRFARDTRFDIGEVYFDQAYLTFSKFMTSPKLTFKVGRMNARWGEGFLLGDGTANDGPRSSYFNMGVLTYKNKNTTLDVMGIASPRYDDYLPGINRRTRRAVPPAVYSNSAQQLNDADQYLGGFYLTQKFANKAQFEGYYFFDTNNSDPRRFAKPVYGNRHLNVFGERTVLPLAPGWTFNHEFVFEKGARKDGVDLQAWAGYGYVRRNWKDKLLSGVQVGYVAMSGDDPGTAKTNESFDPIFGKWAQWGDMYLWTYNSEGGPATFDNSHFLTLEADFTPIKNLVLKTYYYHMMTFHSLAGPQYTAGNTTTTGGTRGDVVRLRGDYQINRNWKAQIAYERMAPGNFYVHKDPSDYFRTEIQYSWYRNDERKARKANK